LSSQHLAEVDGETVPVTGQVELPPDAVVDSALLRWVLFIFASLMVLIGFVGIFVPGLPTTVFLLAALWGYSRSSTRFQHWLWYHSRLGPPIRDWHNYRVIPPRAKMLAVCMMGLSLGYVYYMVPVVWAWWVLAVIFVPVSMYILTRASARPEESVER